jgi:WD40 repeat-containing protein SMU1
MSMEIESDDVLRLIQQFLHENNLSKTLETLQQETSVFMNFEPPSLTRNIKLGHWDLVLQDLEAVHLNPKHLIDLYTQIVLELIESRDVGAARLILRQTGPMESLRELNSERYLELEGLLNRTIFDERVAYGTHSKHERRIEVANNLLKHFTTSTKGRLLELLGQAMKWQVGQGMVELDIPLDIFQQKQLTAEKQDDALVRQEYKCISFPKKQHAEVCCFSPNGRYFAVGTFDGFIEIWNYMTGRIRKDLVYQKEEKMMSMDSCILALDVSIDSEWLVTGSQDGSIAVWELITGKRIKYFLNCHSHGVTSVHFNKDKSQILSASFDHTIKIHGMNSGKALKVFRGHSSFVNVCLFSQDESRVLSGSSDGSVKIWDTKTSDLIRSVYLQGGQIVSQGVNVPTVHSILKVPHLDIFIISNQSRHVYFINLEGELMKQVLVEGKGDFVCCTQSQSGEFVYIGSEEHKLAIIHTPTGNALSQIKVFYDNY